MIKNTNVVYLSFQFIIVEIFYKEQNSSWQIPTNAALFGIKIYKASICSLQISNKDEEFCTDLIWVLYL